MTYDEFKAALAKLTSVYEGGLITRAEFAAELTMLAMEFGGESA